MSEKEKILVASTYDELNERICEYLLENGHIVLVPAHSLTQLQNALKNNKKNQITVAVLGDSLRPRPGDIEQGARDIRNFSDAQIIIYANQAVSWAQSNDLFIDSRLSFVPDILRKISSL